MPQTQIYYGVIAITQEKLEQLKNTLESEGLSNISEWLSNHQDNYGTIPENWKPFDDKIIKEIIEETSSSYTSETKLISDVIEDFSKLNILKSIQVYFIDPLSMFDDSYRELATRMDFAFGDANRCKCCFLINYSIPSIVQESLLKSSFESWSSVYDGYLDGKLHRIASRCEDLLNFKNFLLGYLKGRPNTQTMEQMKDHIPPGGEKPEL